MDFGTSPGQEKVATRKLCQEPSFSSRYAAKEDSDYQ